MKKFIFFFFLFFGFAAPLFVNAAVNWVQEDIAETYSGRHTGRLFCSEGSYSDIGDNNKATFCQAIEFCAGAGCGNRYLYAYLEEDIAFSLPNISVDKVGLTFEISKTAMQGDTVISYRVNLLSNGTWYTVMNQYGNDAFPRQTIYADGFNYPNVTKLLVWVSISGRTINFPLLPYAEVFGTIYEIEAWGNEVSSSYIDCGLRVRNGTETISFACEPAGTLTSPLRIRNSGTTYGVVLVELTHQMASPVRIRINSETKALRRL